MTPLEDISDLAITWVSNCDDQSFPYYLTTFSSLQRSGFEGAIAVLTDNLQDHHRWRLKDLGCHVIDVPSPQNILRDRFLAFWNFLNKHTAENVFIFDSRDVLFQRNPSPYIRSHFYKYNIVLTGEGFAHKTSPFNMLDQFRAQADIQDFSETYVEWPVVNGGLIFGKSFTVRNFCLMVWSNAIRSNCSDQGVINFLYHYLREDRQYHLSDPNVDDFVLTGEAVKHNLLLSPAKFDGKFRNHVGKTYQIVHQWDRTEFRETILNEFGK